MTPANLAAAKAALSHLETDENPVSVRARSRDFFWYAPERVAPHVSPDQALIGLMIAPHAMDAFLTFTARRPGARVIWRTDRPDWDREPGPVFEYGWNHTTLRAQGGPGDHLSSGALRRPRFHRQGRGDPRRLSRRGDTAP